METVHEILQAHRSGISRPGLLAWARLRIDPAMTDAQLEEELARLGDEVVDVDGFLYLRSYVDPSRLPARVGVPAGRAGGPAVPDAGPAVPDATPSPVPDWSSSRPVEPTTDGLGWLPPTDASGWPPPPAGRGGLGDLGALGGIGKLVGIGVFLWWLVSFVGGFVGGDGATPEPTTGPTPAIGAVIGWQEIRVGDCLVVPQEDVFTEVRRVPCDTPHGGEVFATSDHPGPEYPDDGFTDFAERSCGPAFDAWTGSALDDQDLLEISWFTPTTEGWAAGDRTVLCYLYLADGSAAGRSYRAGF